MVGAKGGVLDCGPAKFRQGDDHDILPCGLIRIAGEILAEGVHGPANPTVQIGVIAIYTSLHVMRIKATKLGAGNDGRGLVQHDRRGFQLIKEAMQSGRNRILVEHRCAARSPPASVLFGIGGKEVVALAAGTVVPLLITIRNFVIAEGVACLREINSRKNIQRLAHVLILQIEQSATLLAGEGNAVGGVEKVCGFRVPGGAVGNAQQIIAQRVGQVRHRGVRTTQD